MAKQSELRKERWAFSRSELADPAACTAYDDLIALVTLYDDEGGNLIDEHEVIVYRNGEVSNRFGDGTKGIPPEIAELADDVETLLHPDGEETEGWRDCEVDGEGNFVRFLD